MRSVAARPGILRGFAAVALLVSLPAQATDYYVATNGNDGAAGTNWATALQTISVAVGRTVDNDKILLSNGVHNITAEIAISKGITLRGFWGRDQTVVRRSEATSYRLFTVSHSSAVLEGFELRNGNTADSGGDVSMSAGTIRDCNVTGGNATCGGGLYLSGSCLVTNCLIAYNRGVHGGAGIYMTAAGAVVTHCVIESNTNTYYTGGGGIYMTAGAVRNCLIAGNRVTQVLPTCGGGGVRQTGGSLLHCTIAGNRCVSDANMAGGVWWTGGSISNTIVYGNTRGTVSSDVDASPLTAITYSCAPELTGGTGNITNDPEFVDFSGGDYALSPGSPCVDGGTNVPTLATDLNGATRPVDGDGNGQARWDMGAYEALSLTGGTLRCGFSGGPLVGMAPLTVVYQASVAGTNTAGLIYLWDVDGDGTNEWSGSGLATLTNLYVSSGIYDVILSVSNTAGEIAQKFKAACVTVQAPEMFVSTVGTHTLPFTNWTTAATNLASALVLAGNGTTITVTGGVYNCAGQLLRYATTLRSVNGPTLTTLRNPPGSKERVLALRNSQALLEGFTLTGGDATESGGAVYMSGGTIHDCNVISNKATAAGWDRGGAIYMTGGTLSDSTVAVGNATAGGGIYVDGPCLVTNCLFRGNVGVHGGGAIYMASAGSLVTHCVIRENTNTYYTGGGGIYLGAGTVRDCLIARNRVTLVNSACGGGGVRQAGGALLSCTIVDNLALNDVNRGGGVWWSGGNITNTIIYGNVRGSVANDLDASAVTTIGYCCAPELTSGVGNIPDDPEFIDFADGNYLLSPGSPCIDSGTNVPGLFTDLDGVPRPIDGDGDGQALWDMGAYEAESSTNGILRCGFSAAGPLEDMAPLTVVYEATVAGEDKEGLVYMWDINGDGTNDWIGPDLSTLTNVYLAPGIYSVGLTVSNAAGETAQKWETAYITVQASAMFVSTGGTHTLPFTNWITAATNLASTLALAGDGTVITVADGVYNCAGQVLQSETTLRSVNGPNVTTLQNPPGSKERLLALRNSQALLDGFTLTGGDPNESGGAVYLNGGTVRNCIFFKNSAGGAGSDRGGAIYVEGGAIHDCTVIGGFATTGGGLHLDGPCIVTNCLISGNWGVHGGGGVYVASAGALVTHCIIRNNTNSYYNGGGGIYLTAGTIRNCLISSNRVTLVSATCGGGGVRQTGGTLLSCTIAGNLALNGVNRGGGVWWSGGNITNTIIYGNVRNGVANDLDASSFTTIGYSCAPELSGGVGNTTNDPLFVAAGEGDYRLLPLSPCCNKGSNQTWMVETTDLDGFPRINSKIVDMGAYEIQLLPRGIVLLIR